MKKITREQFGRIKARAKRRRKRRNGLTAEESADNRAFWEGDGLKKPRLSQPSGGRRR